MNSALSRNNSYSPTIDRYETTKLQVACKKGLFEDARLLIENGVDLDLGADPPLHIALRKRHTAIAVLLLQAGADFELRDTKQDYPIHIASSYGLLDVVQVLCALGCSIEVSDINGLFPLHLAAKFGHTHVVRCLCAAGCNIDVRNNDNIRADITALKYGHNDIAELLDKLSSTGQRDIFARQLIPNTKPILRLCFKVLGHCGVGKTALVKSLGAGLFSSLFRRASSLQNSKSRPSSPINTQIEMDVTTRQNSLTFEATANYQSTRGVNVQLMDISTVGEANIWEFSGQESYFPVYHLFLSPSPLCLTAILFSLEDPPGVQLQQVCFWINFLMARQRADLATGEYGKIVLVATHADTTRAVKTSQGEYVSSDAQRILESVYKVAPHVPNLQAQVVVMDANVPASYAFKQLKSLLNTVKQEYLQDVIGVGVNKIENVSNGTRYRLLSNSASTKQQQTIGMGTGLFEMSLAWLSALRKEHSEFPVLSTDRFSELLRAQVNLLASDEHVRDLLKQLHRFGDVFCVGDLVVVSLPWLCSQMLAELLSGGFVALARATGVYSPHDFQATFNCCESLEVLQLLEALHLCIQCDVEDETEYEFPCYNKTETLSGLWDSGHPTYRVTGSCYSGVKLCPPSTVCYVLTSVFSHVQIELRRATSQHLCPESDVDLYQWHQGSKLCSGVLESLITLNNYENGVQNIEIKVRGPRETAHQCFYFFSGILEVVEQAVENVCPGLTLEKHVISAHQLRIHVPEPHSYSPSVVHEELLNTDSILDVAFTNPHSGKRETVLQLLVFDCEGLLSHLHWGCSLHISELPGPAKLRLCGLLDPPEPHGCDWCLLGLKLGLGQERIAALDSAHSSHTMRLLTMADCTIGALVTSLQDLDRQDAAEVVLRSAPLYRLNPDANLVQ